MKPPFILERGIYGPRLTVTGPWTPAITEFMQREGVRELYLNHARGWEGTSLAFLAALPELIAFSIVDFSITDVAAIHRLGALRALEISTYCTTRIDFQCFPLLERCALYWRDGSESLFECESLHYLFLHRYSGSRSNRFARLVAMMELSIANGQLEEVEAIGSLEKLRFLGLYNLRHLKSLHGLERLNQVETLEVNGCKGIDRIDDLAALVHLRRLQLNDDGRIASLRPLQALVDLEDVLFIESSNIVDGDLSPLVGLPHLRNVSFQNRRHYSHDRDEFPLAGRASGTAGN